MLSDMRQTTTPPKYSKPIEDTPKLRTDVNFKVFCESWFISFFPFALIVPFFAGMITEFNQGQ